MNKKIFLLIITLSLILRLGTLFKLLSFTPDEEYLIYIANTLIKNFHIIWIGVSSLGFDLYMGPFWIYIITPFLAITNSDPRILGIISSLLGVTTTGLIYLIGQKFYNKNVGIIASLLHASSALIVYNDQKGYPSGISTISTLIIFSLYMTKYSKKWWIVFFVAFGFVFHIHLSLILLGPIGLYWIFVHKKQINKRYILLSLVAFLLTVSPLIAFDYFHKGSNITVPIRIIKSIGQKKSEITLGYRFKILSNAFGRVINIPLNKEATDEVLFPCYNNQFTQTSKPKLIISLIGIIPFCLFIFNLKNWKNDQDKLLILGSLAFILPFTVLSIVNPVEYYLQGFFPILFLVIAKFIDSLKGYKNVLGLVFVFIFIIFNILAILTAKGDFGINTKIKLVKEVSSIIKEKKFSLYEEGSCQRYGGWRHLFITFGSKPTFSNEDKTFSWLYPDEISKDKPEYTVIINEKRVPYNIADYKHIITEGGFEAIIY